jgi:molybdopterin converting factor small subunit
MLQARTGLEQVIDEPVHDIAGVWTILEQRFPTLRHELADPMLNVAVNDVMLLHGVQEHPVKDGDVLEIVPTFAGG